MGRLKFFNLNEIQVVNKSVEMAEELISNHFKLSSGQLLKLNYDVKTLQDLSSDEIVYDHFAQIIRYAEKSKDTLNDKYVKDFYKICLQDHTIISALKKNTDMNLLAFVLYIVSHELIHIIRFRRFLQKFEASLKERMDEERRVHGKTHEILSDISIEGLQPVLRFYENWRNPVYELENQ